MKMIISGLCIMSLLATVSIGCSTPRTVLQLASQGVVITDKTEAELNEFVARCNRVYEQRLESVRRLSSSDIEDQAKMEFENETAKYAGMQKEADLVKLIRELSAYRMQARENALKKQTQLEESLDVGKPIMAPKAKLAEARKAFAELSEDVSQEEWLKFAFDFGKQVNDSLKKLKEAADNAEKEAKDVKGSLEKKNKQ